jgi:hypothetical protein
MTIKDKIQDLLAKIEFWYAKNFTKINKHYTFLLDLGDSGNTFDVKYLKKYDGVIVKFSNLQVSDDTRLLTFDHDIISNVNNHNLKSKSFERFTRDVVRSILHGAIENDKREMNENRNTNLFESNSKRSIYEKSIAVSEERVSDRKPRKKTV